MHSGSFHSQVFAHAKMYQTGTFIKSKLLKNKLIQGNSKKYATFHKVKTDDETVSTLC